MRSRTVAGPDENAAGGVHPPIRICAGGISASRNRTAELPDREFGDFARQTLRKLSLKQASGEYRSANISMNSEALRWRVKPKKVFVYQWLIRGGPRDIRTRDPVGHDAPLKYRENLPGECRKWPTENFSRTSCDFLAAHHTRILCLAGISFGGWLGVVSRASLRS